MTQPRFPTEASPVTVPSGYVTLPSGARLPPPPTASTLSAAPRPSMSSVLTRLPAPPVPPTPPGGCPVMAALPGTTTFRAAVSQPPSLTAGSSTGGAAARGYALPTVTAAGSPVPVAVRGQSESLMTVEEVAGFLRLTSKGVYAAVKRGVLPCHRVGRLLRFKRSEIEGLVA